MSATIKDLVFGLLFSGLGWHFLMAGLRNWELARARPQFRYMTKSSVVFTGALCALAGCLVLGGLIWRLIVT
jgi:hypothetical protein